MEWIKKVIFARLSSDIVEAAVAELLGYDADFGSAPLGDFGIDNAVNNDLDIVKRLSVDVDLKVRKILVAVDGGGIRRALGSSCVRFSWGYGTV